ncbi:LysR substrate-binding domain-containing protein [Pseudohoeflea coraliihabitans]|uniref:LysR family transcriptional regulator n=1 Tax=Pseudohoeflea coraliihabitans TaxID=2860393 RepID=A0ABS6WJM1_9HYPH|nr:LysR substrate-binding domain-containing protein [Pseudohoeflea sp. DP4N28-3]MBW3096141.1 LysR family transcriptional regulator [Pseudohoeflea sp. DP4N28-3]
MNQPLPSLNALRAFEAAGRNLTFRAAAAELGVTQGAVAQQVRALEATLGVPLFKRHAKGLALTTAGRGYHGRIGEAFATIREATAMLQPGIDRVMISVTPTFAAKWLIPNLPAFSAAHPEIDLRVLATESRSSFHGDGIDLAIRQGSPPFGASLHSHLMFRNTIIAVAAPALLTGKAPMTAEALESLPRLHDGHDLWPRFSARLGLSPHDSERTARGMRFNQTALTIDAALAGQGVALASRFLVERDLNAGQLVQLTQESLTEETAFYLILRRGPQRSEAIEKVVAWLLARAAPDA